MMATAPPRALGAPAARASTVRFHGTVALLALVVLAIHLLSFHEDKWWGDSYQYLLHAENLLSGRPYADTGYVPSPESYIAPVAYPVGFPLLIAPVVAVFGADPLALSVVASLCLIGAAWVAATLVRGTVPDAYAYALVGLVGLQPGLVAISWQPLSDLPFMFFALLSVLAAERATGGAVEHETSRRWIGWAVLAGGAGAAAVLTRTLGIVLVPTVLLPALIRRQGIGAALLAVGVGAALVAAMQFDVGEPGVLITAPEVGSGYRRLVEQNVLRQLAEIPGRIPDRLLDYARGSFPLWLVPGADGLKNGLAALALVPVAVGVIYRVRRRFGVAEVFVVFFAASLLPWSFSGTRYLYPLYPLYYLFFVVGIWWIGQVGHRWRVAALALAVLAVSVSYGSRYLEWAGRSPSSVVDPDAEALYRFARARTAEAAVLATTGDPRRVAYYVRRPAARGPRDAEGWPEFVARLGATHVLVRDGSGGAAWASRNARLLRHEGDLRLYHVDGASRR